MKYGKWTIVLAWCAVLALPAAAWADAAADYKQVSEELKKAPAQQNAALVEQMLTKLAGVPNELTPDQYKQVRLWQAERTVQAKPDLDAPGKRAELNAERLKIVDDLTQHYLGTAVTDPIKRASVYKAQLDLALAVTDSQQSQQAQARVAGAYLADMKERCLTVAEAAPATKAAIITGLLRDAGRVKDAPAREAVYDQLIALGSPESKVAYMDRAAYRLGKKLVAEGLADLKSVIDDEQCDAALRSLARTRRMQALVAGERWNDAKGDAEVLGKVAIADVSGTVFTPLMAAQAKQEAAKVLLAAGAINQEARQKALQDLVVEILQTRNLSADQKSGPLTDILTEQGVEAAQFCQWDQALGYAKAAYGIAPNAKVPATVSLVQKFLANRSRKPATAGDFSLSRNADDAAKAEAFFARQKGSKTVDGQTVTLAADLANDAQFAKHLDGVASPLASDLKTAIEPVASGHADLLTQALAQGLLGRNDEAIATMARAVNALDSDSKLLSGHVNFTARFVRAKLESVALANAFLDSQADGPAGKDGQTGTADDKPNPLTAASK